ncbi:hypothetical protein PR202_ga08686 [Eleusine coracana subsp. coracana]|uniref:NAC domain-containing protein n=1 Tax=Eleusine coracana subsp. coracana TaxID=191504 RepID=A0AAV5C164_ELECO|nr:hypothetical protein QOZ80_1BG0092450 [Eleusine coracana subsp. coracana]GJM92241.1 hypothetical protein PR202_ga08686 [Eleusine coracana subsp. coracana]
MSSGRHENGHGVAAAAAAAAGAGAGGGGGGGKGGGGEGGGDSHEDDLVMPGFRFHPTEEELIEFYLRRKVEGKRFNVELITFLDLYRYDPWELPAMAAIGEKEWFFYVPRDRKYRNGDRPNRVTSSGYWKATGADRMIRAENNRPIGLKKTLVFYSGKAPKGLRSSWIMNEYRLPPEDTDRYNKTEISLCRVYKRSGIDDGRPSSARSRTAQQAASSSSTPTPPTTPSKPHLLHGECTSSPPAVADHAAAGHNKASSSSAPRQHHQLTIITGGPAGDRQHEQGTAAAAMYDHHHPTRNTTTASAFASTYSLLSLVNAASMGGGSSSAAAIDELSTLVGHGPPAAYFNHHHQAGGGHFLPLPTSSPQQPMLPMSVAAVSDKIWDWNNINSIPDAAARDYSSTGFK